MNSITSEAANLPETRANKASSAATTGYESRSDRSVMRYRSRGGALSGAGPTSSAEVPKPASTRAANSPIAGQSTTMSSSRSVGSSASRCKIASRSTWTCRAGPWHECTWIERSPGSRSKSPVGARSARRSCCRRAKQEMRPGPGPRRRHRPAPGQEGRRLSAGEEHRPLPVWAPPGSQQRMAHRGVRLVVRAQRRKRPRVGRNRLANARRRRW